MDGPNLDSRPDGTAAPRRRTGLAFLTSVPIGCLGGLIGLGGAEFRLPVLAGPLGYPARRAVPLNLAVSLVTVAASLGSRGTSLSFEPVAPLTTAVLSLVAGAVVAAFYGTALARRLSNVWLHRVILALLAGIGCLLVVEGLLPDRLPPLLPGHVAWHVLAGVLLGLLIGLVSSLLGVAGGELIIPTLVFGFGADIKAAGTASLLISLPTVAVGVARYAAQGAYADRLDLRQTVAPMGIGSVLGATLGGVLVGLVPAAVLKVGLGVILIASAARVFRGASTRPPPCKRAGRLPILKEANMLSARNQFQGVVKSVRLGGVMAEVVVTVGDIEIVSAITRASAEQLNLQPGDAVKAIIKSTEVIIDK